MSGGVNNEGKLLAIFILNNMTLIYIWFVHLKNEFMIENG
jgi:hypothetical protein